MVDNTGGPPGGQVPPLENSLILRNIFSHCNVEDLKACRQVCKLWHEESQQLWRSKVVVRITTSAIEEGISLEKFLKYVRQRKANFDARPFQNYSLSQGTIPFWDYCGNNIKTLELGPFQPPFPSTDYFHHVIFQACPNLENLTLIDTLIRDTVIVPDEAIVGDFKRWTGRLDIEPMNWIEPKFCVNKNMKNLTIQRVNGLWSNKPFGIRWMEVLAHFPCLENLTLVGKQFWNFVIFRSLRIARESYPTNWNLKQIHFRDAQSTTNQESWPTLSTSPEVVRVLSDPRLKLEALTLNSKRPEDVNIAVNILRVCGPTLKRLDVSYESNVGSLISEPLPGMLENLEELKLQSSWIVLEDWLKCTPHLKRLVIGNHKAARRHNSVFLSQRRMDVNRDILLNRLTELQLYNSTWTSKDDLRMLTRWTPNLEKLVIRVAPYQFAFEMICQYWSKLRELKVLSGSWLDDSAITGLDRVDVTAGCQPSCTVPRANITCFKDLWSFEISANPEVVDNVRRFVRGEFINLGDISVTHGFLQMPRLERLYLRGVAMVSPELLIALAEKIPDFKMVTSDDFNAVVKRPAKRTD